MITSSALTGKPYASLQLSQVPSQLLLSANGYIVFIFSEEKLATCLIQVRELSGMLVSSCEVNGYATCATIAQFQDSVEFLIVCIERKLSVLRLCDLQIVSISELNSRAKSVAFNTKNMSAFAVLTNGECLHFEFIFKLL